MWWIHEQDAQGKGSGWTNREGKIQKARKYDVLREVCCGTDRI
jgi:hypothetical protein